MKNLLAVFVLLASATALRADVFQFSYSSGGLIVTGSVTATDLGGDFYEATNLSGTYNGVAITDDPSGDGSFFYAGSTGAGTFKFLVNGEEQFLLFGPDGW